MDGLDYFFSCFLPVDKKLNVEISDFKKAEYSFDIIVKNALITENGRKSLIQFFGGVPVKVQQIPNTQNVSVQVSRIEMPNTSYSATSILKFLVNNKQKGWFLGIGEFGPIFFDLKKLTHAQMYGASGFGKSSFFRFLLSQTLAFHTDIVNFIIDPKQIDYAPFSQHPRVGKIAKSRDEWLSILSVLVNELSVREHYFSRSFTTPPSSLEEYREFKKDHVQTDLPDFPRLLCWIDECHMLNEQVNDEIQGLSTILMKKGRAFGIHLILTTQRPSDVPNSIKSQASSAFFFYTQENIAFGNMNWDLYGTGAVAIPGRLNYYDAVESKFVTSHVPFINLDESVGMAFKFGGANDYKNDGIYPLQISRFMSQDHRLSQLILKGNSLENLRGLSEKDIESRYKTRSALFKFMYDSYYNSSPSEISKEPKKLAASQSVPSGDDLDDLMKDFNELIQEHKKLVEKENASMPENKSAVAPPASKSVLSQAETDHLLAAIADDVLSEPKKVSTEVTPVILPSIKLFSNTPDITVLLKSTENLLQKSFDHMLWCTRDLSENQGLIKVLQRTADTKSALSTLNLELKDFAIDEVSRSRLHRHLDEIKDNLARKNKSALLIVSGYPGYGKKTLVHTLANELSIPAITATANDIQFHDQAEQKDRLFLANDAREQDEFNKSKKSPEASHRMLLFFDLEAAIQFCRHGDSNTVPVLINEWQSGLAGAFNKTDRDFKVLNEPHLHIGLTPETYRPEPVLGDLMQSLLKKYNFTETVESSVLIKNFSMIGVALSPQNLDSILERASKRALMSQKPFSWALLKDLLESMQTSKKEASNQVKVIIPTKTMDDLVISSETESDLRDIVHKIKSFGQGQFKFAQKLRKGDRLVALFTGPPGTGKSMAGEVLAKECDKELWICDIGRMQSSFVGETEKILSEIFYTAQAAQAVLLFDEADAFLLNRANVSADYTRKWTNHLLNLIEDYKGILILTTNFAADIDEAFGRRIDIKARFFNPNQDQTIRILQSLLEPDAPLAEDFDYKAATQDIRLSGGLVRNAVERLVIKMTRYQVSTIETSLLRSVLLETMEEAKVMQQEQKTIGIAGM